MVQMLNQMQAMVLAAGLGTRMRPLTLTTPKPLVPVAGRPLIEYAFDLLREVGMSEAVVNCHYLADQIERYTGEVQDMTVRSLYEEALLETGGGISHALPMLGDAPFFALNSDTICLSAAGKPVLAQMFEAWQAQQPDLLLLLMPRARAIGYDGAGDFVLDDAGERFRRRCESDGSREAFVFTGAQLLQSSLFEGCPKGAFSMNAIYNRYQTDPEGWFERIAFVLHEGDWLHVGDPEALEQASRYLAAVA